MTINDYDASNPPAKILCSSAPIVSGADVEELRAAGILEYPTSIFGDFLDVALVALEVTEI